MAATPGYMELYDAQLQVNTRIADALERIAEALEEQFIDPLPDPKVAAKAAKKAAKIQAKQATLQYVERTMAAPTVVNTCNRNCACQANTKVEVPFYGAEDRTFENETRP